jgi:hypothetical protein
MDQGIAVVAADPSDHGVQTGIHTDDNKAPASTLNGQSEGVSLDGLDEPTRLLIATLQQQVVILREQLKSALEAENGTDSQEIPLQDARENLKDCLRRLMDGDEDAQTEYDYWDKFVSDHPDHIAEQAQLAAEWENKQRPVNNAALCLTRGFVPSDIQSCSVATLVERGIPLVLAKRIFAKKCLWAVRMDSKLVARLHLADLRGKFSTQVRAVRSCFGGWL